MFDYYKTISKAVVDRGRLISCELHAKYLSKKNLQNLKLVCFGKRT